jgi:hypothetical protein
MSSTSSSTSTQDVITAVVTNGIVCAIFVTLFLLLRLKFKRIYEPKAYCDILPKDERPEKLPLTPLFWIKSLILKYQNPAFIIKYSGIDGYLFLRYLLIVCSFGAGGILTWIILLPVNATGGNNETGLDQLSLSNCKSVGRYYAHVFISWIYYSAIMFTIYRELHFYTNLRYLLLSTPYYSKKLSSRVVIFQVVPDQYLDELEFFKLFDGIKKIWIAKVSKKLTKKIKERDELVNNLENQLNKLLKNAMKIKIKKDLKNEKIDLENELVCYIPQNKWPTIRDKKWLPFFFSKKFDLLEYSKEKILKLNKEIKLLQKNDNYLENKYIKPLNTVTVEFENQYYAQLAYQITIHDQPLHFSPKHIGVSPNDIFWPNMRIFWWEKLFRLSGSICAIIGLIIIWAIPVSFVGFISNLTYLTNKMPWLNFIYKLPNVLLGLITSLLPSVLLAILMMILPIFIRTMAKLSGCLTNQSIEYFTQQAYFAFQVIQTFLVITISSSVSAVVTQIIEEPTSALFLLSTNLPKSSNFFISYIILNGFSVSGGILFQIVTFILFYIFSFLFDSTVRKKYNRYISLGSMSWGTTYPIYEVLSIISIAYSIISPIILLFTFFAFLFIYLAYMNTLNYIVGIDSDNLGINYPRSIFHLFVGIYLGELCLLGLFVVSKSWGCVVLEAIFIGITVFFHIQMNIAFDKLIKILPITCMKPLDGKSETLSWKNNNNNNNEEEEEEDLEFYHEKIINEPLLIEGDRTDLLKPNLILRYLQPWKYLTYHDIKEYIPASYWEYPSNDEDDSKYACPDLSAKCPTIWIPRDPMGLSKVQIESFKGIVPMSDENAGFDSKGKIIYTGAPPTVELEESEEDEDQIEKEYYENNHVKKDSGETETEAETDMANMNSRNRNENPFLDKN